MFEFTTLPGSNRPQRRPLLGDRCSLAFSGVLALALTMGCEGQILTSGGPLIDPTTGQPVVANLTCDPSQYPGVKLEDALAEFKTNVYPALTAGESTCLGCHGAASKRRFLTTTDAAETFYLAREGGYFKSQPGSLLDRVTAADPMTIMPAGGEKPLPTTVVEAIARTACMVQTFEANGGPAADEVFPPELLTPFVGAPNTDYDNPFVNYLQLKSKVKAVFNDTWVRSGVDNFAKNIGLFGGVDFTSHFVEARVATSDFLLGLDLLAPDVCRQAATAKTGPFAGINVTQALTDSGTATTNQTAAKAGITLVYQRMLYRDPTATELTNTLALMTDLVPLDSVTGAWSGACEALIRHPDFLFTLPPSYSTATDPSRPMLISLAQQLLGRPPTQAEFTQLGTAGLSGMVDAYLKSPDFQAYYFTRMQLRVESQGTPESDESARLWTWLVFNGQNFEELFTGDYSIDTSFTKQPRAAEHGRTGVLTMKGYVSNKPGLPHYNYPARVLSGFMGSIFEIPPEVFAMRAAATAASTVDPTSICFNCHQLLTPLAHQRLKWDDNGDYRTVDATGAAIDDSDRGLVPTYPYKGVGMEAFTTRAVKKEAFIRRMLNTEFVLLMGREMRSRDDERVIYKQLWDTAFANGGDLRQVIKTVALSNTFQRKQP